MFKMHFIHIINNLENFVGYLYIKNLTNVRKMVHTTMNLVFCLVNSVSIAHLLRSWVRIPPGAWMFVCYECCVLSGRGLYDGLITRPRSPTECGASLCVIKKPRKRGG